MSWAQAALAKCQRRDEGHVEQWNTTARGYFTTAREETYSWSPCDSKCESVGEGARHASRFDLTVG